MNSYKDYINDLMSNYPLNDDYDNYYQNQIQIGGEKDIPTGGFPPIHICEKKIEKDIKKREYTKHKELINIKDIMERRQTVTPFISISGMKKKPKKKKKRRKKKKTIF